MNTLTQEQYEQLQAVQQHLDTAYHSNYVRTVTMQDARLMQEIYQQVTHHSANLTCGKCVLAMCSTLANLYFNYKKDN